MDKTDAIIHTTMMNQYSIVIVFNSINSFDRTYACFFDKKLDQFSMINMNQRDKIIMLNQKFDTRKDLPVLVKLTNNQLGFLTNIQQSVFDFQVLRKFNNLNQDLISSSNCSLFVQEESFSINLYVLKKLEDGGGCIWQITLNKKFIRNILAKIQSNYQICPSLYKLPEIIVRNTEPWQEDKEIQMEFEF